MKSIPTSNRLMMILLGLVLAAVVGCSQSGDPTSPAAPTEPAATGTISFSVSALPAEYEAAKARPAGGIQFDDIVLVLCGISAHRASDDELDGWYGWSFEPVGYSLSDLSTGLSSLIAGADLPAGSYNQVRLQMEEGSYVVVEGVEYPLSIVSNLARGIAIKFDFEIVEGEEYAAMITFDTQRSLALSRSGEYQLKPRIRISMIEEIDGTDDDVTVEPESGAISGFVNPPAAEASISVNTGEGVVTVAADAATGEFLLPDLAAGTYAVQVTPAEGTWYPSISIVGVEVLEGQTTDMGTVQLLVPLK